MSDNVIHLKHTPQTPAEVLYQQTVDDLRRCITKQEQTIRDLTQQVDMLLGKPDAVHLGAQAAVEALRQCQAVVIERDRLRSQPCPDDFKHKIFTHKHLDPECIESGCRSLQHCQPPGCPEGYKLVALKERSYPIPPWAEPQGRGDQRHTELVAELAPISGEPQPDPFIGMTGPFPNGPAR